MKLPPDDIADELFSIESERRLDALDSMSTLISKTDISIENCSNPIFIALSDTIKELNLPISVL